MLLVIIYLIIFLKRTSKNKDNLKKIRYTPDGFRVNQTPCNQKTKRCYYPYTKDKDITSYICCKNNLVELLSFIVDFFDKHNVTYFLDYGTLLGCARDNNFIKWDTDIDLSVIENDNLYEALNKLQQNKKGYDLVKDSNNLYRLNYSTKNKLHVDIGIRRKNENYYYDKYGSKYYINVNDLFPLKTSIFENISVKIPRNYIKYLDNAYGKDSISLPKVRSEM